MSSSHEHCFVRQEATEEILHRVGTLCAECYRELLPGESIYYDLTHYRYLCQECADSQAQQLDEACEVEEEPPASATLFG